MVSTRFMQRAVDCGVCRNAINVQGVLNCCTHSFCLDCVLKWAEIENSCPVCKRRFGIVTTRWARKCLKEGVRPQPQKQYTIEEKSQNAHTSMVYETSRYTIRISFPTGGELQYAGLIHYLENLVRNIHGGASQVSST